MKIRDLIKKLQEYPQDLNVIVSQGASVFTDAKVVSNGYYFEQTKDFKINSSDDDSETNGVLIR